MKTQEFQLTSHQLVVTDPGYDLETAGIDGLGAIVSRCKSGVWSVSFSVHRSLDGDWDEPRTLIAVHRGTKTPAHVQWHPQARELGGDTGMIGIFDAAHFHDALLVPSDTRWTFGGAPADPSDLWYSWVCEHASKGDCVTFDHGVVVNWDRATSVDVAFDASGAVAALRLGFHAGETV